MLSNVNLFVMLISDRFYIYGILIEDIVFVSINKFHKTEL